jgi:hypothetical protein
VWGFYAMFAGVSNAWYLLPLLPFLPFADARWSRALAVGAVTPLLLYASDLRFRCGVPPGWVFFFVSSLTQGVLSFGVPLALRRVDARRSEGSLRPTREER